MIIQKEQSGMDDCDYDLQWERNTILGIPGYGKEANILHIVRIEIDLLVWRLLLVKVEGNIEAFREWEF